MESSNSVHLRTAEQLKDFYIKHPKKCKRLYENRICEYLPPLYKDQSTDAKYAYYFTFTTLTQLISRIYYTSPDIYDILEFILMNIAKTDPVDDKISLKNFMFNIVTCGYDHNNIYFDHIGCIVEHDVCEHLWQKMPQAHQRKMKCEADHAICNEIMSNSDNGKVYTLAAFAEMILKNDKNEQFINDIELLDAVDYLNISSYIKVNTIC